MTTSWQTARKPHRFRVQISDAECGVNYFAGIAAGLSPEDIECCWPLCYIVTEIECPYGPSEEHVDCALWMECNCIYPDNDPQYDDSANFNYKFNLDKPVGDPDRYVRVWEEGSTAEGIAKALAYELAMEEYEEKHECGSYERVDPPQCWVATWAEGVDEALERALGEMRVGWHTAYVDNGGSIDESYLDLELVVPEVPA